MITCMCNLVLERSCISYMSLDIAISEIELNGFKSIKTMERLTLSNIFQNIAYGRRICYDTVCAVCGPQIMNYGL